MLSPGMLDGHEMVVRHRTRLLHLEYIRSTNPLPHPRSVNTSSLPNSYFYLKWAGNVSGCRTQQLHWSAGLGWRIRPTNGLSVVSGLPPHTGKKKILPALYGKRSVEGYLVALSSLESLLGNPTLHYRNVDVCLGSEIEKETWAHRPLDWV